MNSYYTYAVRYEGEKKLGVSWYDFRMKFMELGGDGIYAANALIYNEPIMQTIHKEGRLFPGFAHQAKQFKGFLKGVNCPVAEVLHPKLMMFTANQGIERDMDIQIQALKKTIQFFEK